MKNQLFQCIDAGGENCPCYLAESGNCLTCSRLAGRECVDCRWSGVCIYNEYIQNGKVIKNVRREQEAAIAFKKKYDEETVVMALDVGMGMAMKCLMPGTYLFLRQKETPVYFNAPISVMGSDVEKGRIWILVKAISAKTKGLLQAENSLVFRGPYKNGIFGLEQLNRIIQGQKEKETPPAVLILAKGAGIAPLSKMIQFLGSRVSVTVFLDPAKLTEELIQDCLPQMPDRLFIADFTQTSWQTEISRQIQEGEYEGLCIFASDYYISLFGDQARASGNGKKLLISNNFNLCCGEGICGACSTADENGETMKMCKCKLSGEELVKRKIIFG